MIEVYKEVVKRAQQGKTTSMIELPPVFYYMLPPNLIRELIFLTKVPSITCGKPGAPVFHD